MQNALIQIILRMRKVSSGSFSPFCYSLSLLPLIICLGRLCIACRYIFNWQLCQGFDSGSVVRALDLYLGRPGSNPTTGGKYFQLCFIPLLWLSCHKMGARPGWHFTSPKMASRHHKWWLLKEWECYGLSLLPLIIHLGRLRIACAYNFNLWQLHQGVNSLVVSALDFYPGRPGSNPKTGRKIFQFASFLCYENS